MPKGNKIIVSDPKGRFVEGTVTGALLPGIFVQIDVSEGLDANGYAAWEPYAPGTDGAFAGAIGILVPQIDGQTATEAYTDGDQCLVYFPVNGEEFNLLVQDASSSFGDIMIPDNTTGRLIADAGTPDMKPIQMLEATGSANVLGHCIYTGT